MEEEIPLPDYLSDTPKYWINHITKIRRDLDSITTPLPEEEAQAKLATLPPLYTCIRGFKSRQMPTAWEVLDMYRKILTRASGMHDGNPNEVVLFQVPLTDLRTETKGTELKLVNDIPIPIEDSRTFYFIMILRHNGLDARIDIHIPQKNEPGYLWTSKVVSPIHEWTFNLVATYKNVKIHPSEILTWDKTKMPVYPKK